MCFRSPRKQLSEVGTYVPYLFLSSFPRRSKRTSSCSGPTLEKWHWVRRTGTLFLKKHDGFHLLNNSMCALAPSAPRSYKCRIICASFTWYVRPFPRDNWFVCPSVWISHCSILRHFCSSLDYVFTRNMTARAWSIQPSWKSCCLLVRTEKPRKFRL